MGEGLHFMAKYIVYSQQYYKYYTWFWNCIQLSSIQGKQYGLK